MDIKQFDETADELKRYASALSTVIEDSTSQARDALLATSPPMNAPSKESAAGLILCSVSSRIEDVMGLHDRLLRSLELQPRYEVFFDSLN